MDNIFGSILELPGPAAQFTVLQFLICTATSLVLGFFIALAYMYRNNAYTKSFIISLATMPVVVQVIITLVNGNLGAGIAVFGAFSLIRFRSAEGNAREISNILMAAALGLATGMGFLFFAVIFAIVICLVNILFTMTSFGEPRGLEHDLRITIPEDLDYSGIFDDIFEKYSKRNELVRVKMTNLGTLYQLTYRIELKPDAKQNEMINEIRCRNGNLEITCMKLLYTTDEVL